MPDKVHLLNEYIVYESNRGHSWVGRANAKRTENKLLHNSQSTDADSDPAGLGVGEYSFYA